MILILLNDPCSRCKNTIESNEEFVDPKCRAFPKGIPYEYIWEKDVT